MELDNRFNPGIQRPVYQRFSGYVARHRLAQFCEGILGTIENLQETAIAGICDYEESRLDPQALVSRLEAITVELRSMLADLNAFGDGSLAEGVEQHVAALAGQLGKVPRFSRVLG
ncbi:hypothetical protein AK812_SmicGene18065 [Symbiodinium microadriaticum]|uniref:Uncharacterized protein n=1 Tax=Symbiodinium microadriaticum TaxID=2951 RepID=A0A1Q9DW33_SYMMI|nr:hypothetical protein AK812_SmicGene18065 [Symbiodinium microadriaticum]